MTDKMFMGASTKQGLDIANKSREIIRETSLRESFTQLQTPSMQNW